MSPCDDDTATLFRTYDPVMWWIDRIGQMAFLGDQMFADSDRLMPGYWRLDDFGLGAYII